MTNFVRNWAILPKESTHVITISHCGYVANEEVAGMFQMVGGKDVASTKAQEAVRNHEWGKTFGYESEYNPSHIFCYTAHYPRWISEKDGFVNHHSVVSVRGIEPSDFIPDNRKDCYLFNDAVDN